ncbi:cytochrome P450 [Streptomyces tricolor]|nr:cytochrome P450 [Streptomyces tricolor]
MSEMLSYEEVWSRTHHFDPPAIFDKLREERPLARMSLPGRAHRLVHHQPPDRPGGPQRSPLQPQPGAGALPRHQVRRPRTAVPGAARHVHPHGPAGPHQVPPHAGTRVHRPAHRRTRPARRGRWPPSRSRRCAPTGAPADLLGTFAKPLVLRILSDLVGLPYEERERYADAPAITHDPDGDAAEAMAVYEQVGALIGETIERKRKQPGDDIISRLLAAGELTDEELGNIVALLLFAGYETTESALSVGVRALLHHPGATRRAAPPISPGSTRPWRRSSAMSPSTSTRSSAPRWRTSSWTASW